jgi:hypothetical protein
MLSTVPSTGGFKENHALLWFSKSLQKRQEKSSLFMNSILQNGKNAGKKPDKN